MVQTLFVHGGGEGSYEEDRPLAGYLERTLRGTCELRCPRIGGLEAIDWPRCATELSRELDAVGERAIVIGHSLGGAAVLKLLAEAKVARSLRALYLVATPYKCVDGEWGTDDFALPLDIESGLARVDRTVLHHSRDDEWVPFEHLARYAEKLPLARIVEFADRGHAFTAPAFRELVEDIEGIL